jgi:hypothetical protein
MPPTAGNLLQEKEHPSHQREGNAARGPHEQVHTACSDIDDVDAPYSPMSDYGTTQSPALGDEQCAPQAAGGVVAPLAKQTEVFNTHDMFTAESLGLENMLDTEHGIMWGNNNPAPLTSDGAVGKSNAQLDAVTANGNDSFTKLDDSSTSESLGTGNTDYTDTWPFGDSGASNGL